MTLTPSCPLLKAVQASTEASTPAHIQPAWAPVSLPTASKLTSRLALMVMRVAATVGDLDYRPSLISHLPPARPQGGEASLETHSTGGETEEQEQVAAFPILTLLRSPH